MDDFQNNIDENLKNLELMTSLLDKTNDELKLINNEIYKYENTNLDENILMKRPSFCAKHQCGIIDELMKYLNPKNNLQDLYDKSKELQTKVNSYQENKTSCENSIKDLKMGFNYYKEIIDFLYKNNELISKTPELIQNILIKDPAFIYVNMNELKLLMNDFNEYTSLFKKYNDLKKSNDDLNNLKKLVTNNVQVQNKLTELEKKHSDAMSHKLNCLTKIDELNERYNFLSNIHEILQERDDNFLKYNIRTEELKKIKQNILELNKCTYIYNSNKNYIERTLTKQKLELENELQDLNKKRDEMTTFYISKRQIEKMRNEVQEQFNKINILNKIWSPKVGYPSWKIESFLNDLTVKTNDDMESMWGSNLKIKEFELKDSDFLIKMNKEGVEIKDASLCSQGETETINTAISFSIIESNVENGGYDVLRLDEVDGPLDETRRTGFIDMIQKRVDDMGCNSCFIITHNGEFEDIPCDIILLKGAKVPDEKLRNKNILFKYQGD
jgi:DNA repair exonuclease SbcCD ATPase subunit